MEFIDGILLSWKIEMVICEVESVRDDLLCVKIEMSKGELIVELFED